MTSTATIPTVDLEDIRSNDPVRTRRASEAILEAFGRYGLAYVKNHGVDATDPVYDRWSNITARSREAKEKHNRPDLWYQRGWTPPNTEKAVASSGQPDFKECWFAAPMPLDQELEAQFPQIYAANVWPEDDPTFESLYMKLGRELHAAGLLLLRGAAEALELPSDTFTKPCDGAAHVLRLLRYLPLTDAQIEAKVLWGEEHTDFNLLTLLPGGRFHDPEGQVAKSPDEGSGLYLRTRGSDEHPEGELVRGAAPPGCIVAQVGQMLEILTGGVFLATPHVVTAPHSPGWSRMSAAHFVHVHSHTLLFPLPKFRTHETIRAYSPPVLAGTYSIKTLVDIGLAPKSEIDSLGYRHYDRLNSQRERLKA